MQTAQPGNYIVAGTQVEVIGIGEHKRGAQVLDLGGGERLDRRLCSNGSKNRRKKIAVRCCENPRASTVVFGCDVEIKHGMNYTIVVIRRCESGLKLAKTSRERSEEHTSE